MKDKLAHKYKMLRKLANRKASEPRIDRAMRAYLKEKERMYPDDDDAFPF